jgi:hypothetical protein
MTGRAVAVWAAPSRLTEGRATNGRGRSQW